ncbi:MAG: Mur ligase family protein [Bacteroidia bacterium]
MKIHLIATGGAAMHNMAIALHKKGFTVTGSDDEINEPSRSRLAALGLLPDNMGWHPEKITTDIDAVILGMHARADNPELICAQELGLKIYSYPEYIYEQSRNKTRVVIGGSHGKTTITSMILHVLKVCNKRFDFMVGAQIAGFDTMVQLSEDAPVIIVEGDEYLSSPIDRRPKFHLYKADIGLISGIAWDHINVFPTFENYTEQFRIFADAIPANGKLIYCENDAVLKKLCEASTTKAEKIPYTIPPHEIKDGITHLITDCFPAKAGHAVPRNDENLKPETLNHKPQTTNHKLVIFGNHNLMNLEGARHVCNAIGVSDDDFYNAIISFTGAAKRLELVVTKNSFIMFKDFAHSPSKLKATTEAVKQQFAGKQLIACMELHTFSSLNEDFLNEYNGAMNEADEAYIYFNPHTIEHKKLKPISEEQVANAFKRNDIKVFTNSTALVEELKKKNFHDTVLLMMSSGNFDGIDFKGLGDELALNV